MGSMWPLWGLCGCYRVDVAVMGSMWLLRGPCGRYGVYVAVMGSVAVMESMWLLWGLCSCYGVYMALPGKWPRNSHIIIDPVTATRWPCRTPYCGNRLTWLLQNGFTVRPRLSGHIGTDTYPDTWFRPFAGYVAPHNVVPQGYCAVHQIRYSERGKRKEE